MTKLTTIATAVLDSENIGAGEVQVYSGTLTGNDPLSVIATIQITNRGGGAAFDLFFRGLVGGRLLFDNTIEYLGTATASLEIQTLPFRWKNGETLQIYVQSSDADDDDVDIDVIIETEDAPEIDNASIATAVVEKVVSGANPVGSVGYWLNALGSMIEYVSSVWRLKNSAVINVTDKLPDALVDGRIKSAISDEQVIDVGNQIVLATLQTNPASVATRSIEDTKPLTFSWPNSTDTITGQVSIDNGAPVPVEGAITYLREENGKHYFTLAYDSADRPTEEGTARYTFTSNTYTMYATLRTINRPSSIAEIERNGGMLHSVKGTIDEIFDVVSELGATSASNVVRPVDDTKPINFVFPTADQVLTGVKSINGGVATPVVGSISPTNTGLFGNWYKLNYNSSDRTLNPGDYVVYTFTDGISDVNVLLNLVQVTPVSSEIKEGLALENTSQDIKAGVIALGSNDRSEFY